MNAVSTAPDVPVTLATAWTVASAPFTVSAKVLDDVAPAASVTVTVNVVVASVVVGVPLTWPVPVLKLIPAGSAPPVSANAYGVVPPFAVTGVNDGIRVLTVPVLAAMACTVPRAELTVRVNVFDEVAPAASVTVTVNAVAGSVAIGVPLTSPLAVLKPIPAGSPPVSAKAYGAVPALAVTGVNDGISVLSVPVVAGTDCAVVRAGFTVSAKVFADVAPAASVTVTVNVVVTSVLVGVPVTWPVAVLKLIPVGNAPPLSANAYAVVPPLAVTGVNAVIGAPLVPVLLATACVVVRGPFTVSVNVFEDAAPAASVAVTVNTVAASVAVGVPLTAPLTASKLIPAGREPPVSAKL